MDWNGLLHNHETFVHPCVFLQRGLAKTVRAFQFVLHHVCSYFMALCSAGLPSNSLIVGNQSERNCVPIDGTTKHVAFLAALLQHHTSTNANTIACPFEGILLLCLLRLFTMLFKRYSSICLRAT